MTARVAFALWWLALVLLLTGLMCMSVEAQPPLQFPAPLVIPSTAVPSVITPMHGKYTPGYWTQQARPLPSFVGWGHYRYKVRWVYVPPRFEPTPQPQSQGPSTPSWRQK